MGSEECWECKEEFSRNEVLDIPVFKTGWTVKWCFNCVMKQLEWSDYRLIPKPQKYKKFKVQSSEDHLKLDRFYNDELLKGYDLQFKNKISHEDWKIVSELSWDMVHPENEE